MGSGLRLDIMVVNKQPLTAHLLGHVLSGVWPHEVSSSAFATCKELCSELATQAGSLKKLAIIYSVDSKDSLSEDCQLLEKSSTNTSSCCLVALVDDTLGCNIDELRGLGFNGVISSNFNVQQLSHAFGLIASGVNFFPDDSDESDHEIFASHALSIRQQQVMAMLTKGLPNKRIAAQLGISERTIKIHVSAIMKKLNADNRTHAVSLYKS